MELSCKIYVDSDLSCPQLATLIAQWVDGSVRGATVHGSEYEIDILANHEANVQHKKEFPDGFLYFARLVEFYTDASEPVAQQAAIVTRILETLWSFHLPAVAACDYEDLLPHRGGYRSRDVPWPTA